jgi:drug/metabolite transporter (DMT)-like permease
MNVRPQDGARLIALAVIWSASFVFIRVLVPVIGPLWVAAGRLLVAGLALTLGLAIVGTRADVRTKWRTYLVIGVVNCAAPFVLYAYAAAHLPASYLVILNATTPLFGVVLAALVLGDRVHVVKGAGVVAGIAGVVLVTRAVPIGGDAQFGWAVAAGLGAAACYAIAAVWLKRNAGALSPMCIAAWSQLLGGLVVLPAALPSHVPGPIVTSTLVNLLLLALLCSGVAYLLYYRLIRDIGPTRALTVTFLMPAFGMLWGAWLLDESITEGMIWGACLIVAGTAAVLRAARGEPASSAPMPRARA